MAEEQEEMEMEIEFITEDDDNSLEIDSEDKKDKPTDDGLIEINTGSEEEQEDEEQEDESEKDSIKPSDKDSTNTIIPFAQTLKEDGVLSDLSFKDEEGNDIEITGEVLKNAVEAEIQKREFADLNEDTKALIEITRNGGDVSKYLQVYQSEKNLETEYTEINETNAEEFTRELLKLEGTNPKRIEDIIDDRTINGTLVEKANKEKDYFKELTVKNKELEINNSKAQAKAQEEAYKKQQNDFKELVEKTETIIKGEKLNKTTREKIYNLATQPVGTDSNGNSVTAFQKSYMEDPNGMEIKLNYLFAVTDGFTKMENLSRSDKAKTKAIQDLDKKLQQERNNTVGRTSSTKTNNNNKPDILSALDMFK